MLEANPLFRMLRSLGVSDESSIAKFADRTRDLLDIDVWRCSRSGAILLSRVPHDGLAYYETKTGKRDEVAVGRTMLSPGALADDERRAAQFKDQIAGRRWLDIGTGSAGIMDRLGAHAGVAVGIEPQVTDRLAARSRGLDVRHDMADVAGETFDVISLFHVLEHVADPVGLLRSAVALLSGQGKIIVEVPHARDALIDTYQIKAFINFTLWSEHLVLHTRGSLEAVLRAADLEAVHIAGHQRYGLANHLYWLRHDKPGGHLSWAFLGDEALDSAYGARLAALDRTDTLIAVGSRQTV